MTDEEIILKHDVSIRPRARMDLKIINQIIKSAEEFCYVLQVENSDSEENKYDSLKEEIFDLDDTTLLVLAKTRTGNSYKEFGWIYLVFGNNGYDCISDYTTNLEDFLKDANQLAERLENGLE